MTTLTDLVWRSSAYPLGADRVKGTELATAVVPGTLSRFVICETRSLTKDGNLSVVYRLRDAHTVSDADIRRGIRAHIVAVHESPEAALRDAYERLNAGQ